MLPEGFTRTTASRRYAVIPPESRVATPLPGWLGCTAQIAISGAAGAGFVQMQVDFTKGAKAAGETWGFEYFLFVTAGKVAVDGEGCGPGDFAYLPPGHRYDLRGGPKGGRAIVFQKRYEPLAGHPHPAARIATESEIAPEPLADGVWSRLLLPADAAFDATAEIVEVEPGMTLGPVAAPACEEGTWMLDGQGLWRLEASWSPAQAGDALWVAPFCPRWFAALGRTPARMLRFRDAHRQPL